jgi:hypothetical protein
MKKIIVLISFSFSSIILFAQNVGIGTLLPKARLHVTDSSVAFSATGTVLASPGNPPLSGAGRRMMWYADKAAFRIGYVDGTQWDKNNIGNFSIATGANSIASGGYAFASGFNNLVSGDNAVAFGSSNTVSAPSGFTNGLLNLVAADFSTAFGVDHSAMGRRSFITGSNNKSKTYAGFIAGTFNDSTITGDANIINNANRLFQIGNGTADNARSNAVTVLQNGNTGIGTVNPSARLHVVDSNVLFSAVGDINLTPDNPPISGDGRRMMWYADKAAFRSGYVNNASWNKDSIGNYSFATGYSTKASGFSANASGYNTIASGDYSVASGKNTIASGLNSNASGVFTEASGYYSIATGVATNASGDRSLTAGTSTTAKGYNSVALNYFTQSNAYASTVVGLYNDTIVAAQQSISNLNNTTPLFIVGNGSIVNGLSNAMVVCKDGSTDINGSLEVNSLKINSGAAANAFLKSDAAGNASWISAALVETDPRVGNLADTYIPKWNNTTTQLVISSIRENANGVGIGVTPQPNERLAVSGNISISPSYDYKYASPKPKTITIPAAAFQLMPVNGLSTAGLTKALATNNGGGLYVDNGLASIDAFFDAPLSLPVGAEITGIDLFVRDLSNTGEVSGELFRFDNITFSPISIGTITGTGVAATTGNTTISGIFSQTTDADNSYFIRIKTKENTIGLRIFGAKITYTVNKVD